MRSGCAPGRRSGVALLCAALAGAGLLSAGAAAGAPRAAHRQGGRQGGSFAILSRLVEIPGVSTHEERVREAIRGLLPSWAHPSVDAAGNLLVAAGPEHAGTNLLFIAHMDETGYLVERIGDDGRLSVRRVGGFFETLYEGQVVLVHTAKGDRGGVVPPRADYFGGPIADPADFGGADLLIDLGTRDRAGTVALDVAPGDFITVPKEFHRLAGSRGTGRAIDDRAGCTALLLALRSLDPGRLKNRVTFAFSVQEETGLDGAQALTKTEKPGIAIAIDTFVSSDSPLERPAFAGAILGRGPVVRAVDNSYIADPALVDRVAALAREAGLPLQIGLTRGGNDASVFGEIGARTLAISWPTVHSHSAVEVIDEGDLDRLGDLTRLLAERL